jgi:small subunit ribosomal protein S9
MATGKYYEGIGRRKSAVARVRLFSGGGGFTVNERPVDNYFPLADLFGQVMSPLKVTQNEERFTVTALVHGGGPTGQADAVSLGIARALLAADEAFKNPLRKAGLLTRDARAKERKKPGLKRARKAKQYTKR